MLTVQKFGGSSVADARRMQHVAQIIAAAHRRGEAVVAVLSAPGDTTDELLAMAEQLSPCPDAVALDLLLTIGEQASVALMELSLKEMGYRARGLTGWQVAVRTDDVHGNARIAQVETEKIKELLEQGYIVLVAGFQGIAPSGQVTTLGRGGSDTTAVALAAALGADRCQIFTDVDGVYTADPRKFPQAEKYEEITYEKMLELIEGGAQVLHDRCVLLARDVGMEIEVLSAFADVPGTKVK